MTLREKYNIVTTYHVKMSIGIPHPEISTLSTKRSDVQWRMIDLGYEFTDYIECKKFVDRLVAINGVEGTAIDFWISSSDNTQS